MEIGGAVSPISMFLEMWKKKLGKNKKKKTKNSIYHIICLVSL